MTLQLFRLLPKMEVTLCDQKRINKERKPADIPHCKIIIYERKRDMINEHAAHCYQF